MQYEPPHKKKNQLTHPPTHPPWTSNAPAPWAAYPAPLVVVDALLLLLPLATTVALSAVLAITVIGYQISYAIVSTKNKHKY